MKKSRILKNYMDLMSINRRKTTLFSGSFNPPHLGHLAVIEYVLDRFVDQIIVFPHSYNHKKKLVDIAHRINMLQILFNGSSFKNRIFLCDPNFHHGISRDEYTLATICNCLGGESYVSILIGSDAINSDYPEILKHLHHFIHDRRFYRISEGDKKTYPYSYTIFATNEDRSSTLFRNVEKCDWKFYVGGELMDYIIHNDLYGHNKKELNNLTKDKKGLINLAKSSICCFTNFAHSPQLGFIDR